MSRTPTILHLIADSQKHVVNPADPATRTPASITTTKGSTFHTSSKNSAWIIDLGATDHMTFDPDQLINRKSFTPPVVSNANGMPSLVDILTGTTIGYGTRRGKVYYLDWAPDNESQLGSNRPLPENQHQHDLVSPCYPTQGEETDEIWPTPETSSALVLHQSPTEDVIHVTSCPETDNINEISRDNLISEGTKPAYQIPKRKTVANL
ncbi:hypothetical protein L3X38_018391 [Prunus dulcis]|uniref:Uncharacterized protein n=1 Tax=Prunus dulcis TaxID=3755 RepID=A0AAD4W956_PRUDU|nr:hypothetical protein L3X38_018391 [Prunus dulcis]